MQYSLRVLIVGLLPLAGALACASYSMAPSSIKVVKAAVEAKLPAIAARFEGSVPPADAIYAILEAYLAANPEFFGATFAVEPARSGTAAGLSPYVFRKAGRFERKDLAQVPGYDYASQPWFAEPRRLGLPRWSAPYFDEGGGDINMITYSIPVYTGGVFLGILTTDVGIDGRPAE